MGNSENEQPAKINYQWRFSHSLCSTWGKCSRKNGSEEVKKSKTDLQSISVFSTSNSGCLMLAEFEESNRKVFGG